YILLTTSATSWSSTLSLHDALPILRCRPFAQPVRAWRCSCNSRRSWLHSGGRGYRRNYQGEQMTSKSLLCIASLAVTLAIAVKRSEEHTSELQSPYELVCCLLLEK